MSRKTQKTVVAVLATILVISMVLGLLAAMI